MPSLRSLTVSIHAPAKGATCPCCSPQTPSRPFQSTPPQRGRRPNDLIVILHNTFQSTPPQGGDLRLLGEGGDIDVSIHAPAKGATGMITGGTAFSIVSIHAPAKGATVLERTVRGFIVVSIHAPAKGATTTSRPPIWQWAVSIHAPAKGATPKVYLLIGKRQFWCFRRTSFHSQRRKHKQMV